MRTEYAFDKVFEHYNDRCAGSTKYEDRTFTNTPKRNSGMKREDYIGITTTSQSIGWHKPYDKMIGQHNQSGICMRTFYKSTSN